MVRSVFNHSYIRIRKVCTYSLILFHCFPLLLGAGLTTLEAQTIIQKTLFNTDSLLHITLTADFDKINKTRQDSNYHKAIITFHLQKNDLTNNIRIRTRGIQRKEICKTAPLQLDFNIAEDSALKKLGKLKLVNGCDKNNYEEQLILKEYLVYKLYNQITGNSFRARLIYINYVNSVQKSKSYNQYAFLLEDTDDMARRNNATQITRKIVTEQTNRKAMTMLAVFQYMIGNTDWSVPELKNIKLIKSKEDKDEKPIAVPYDFDYSGFVNANYAIPNEYYKTESVKERVYRGFPRTTEEIQAVLDTLKIFKQYFYDLISNFNLLTPISKKEILDYLEGFYKQIEKKRLVKEIFITNARRE